MKSSNTCPTLLISLSPLTGRQFDDNDEFIQEVEQWFSMQSEDFYNDGMRSVKLRWVKCKTRDGDYGPYSRKWTKFSPGISLTSQT